MCPPEAESQQATPPLARPSHQCCPLSRLISPLKMGSCIFAVLLVFFIHQSSGYCVCKTSVTCRGQVTSVPICPSADRLNIFAPSKPALLCSTFDWSLALSNIASAR